MINISARGFELKQGAKDGIAKELRRVEKMLPQTAAFNPDSGAQRRLSVRHHGSGRGELYPGRSAGR